MLTTDRRVLLEVRDRLTAALPRYLDDLATIVGIDSFAWDKAGSDRVAAWVASRMRDLGATVRVHAHDKVGDTIVGEWSGAADGPCVLVVGHVDTVFPAGTVAERPFRAEQGRAYGPGVNDMKAGLLSGLYAIEALRSATGGNVPWGRLVFVANADEEVGSPFSRPIILEAARGADLALVLEAPSEDGAIISARKGFLGLRLTVTGRAAHAGIEPEAGRNSIVEAAHLVREIDELGRSFDATTVNVTKIDGGSATNVIPETTSLVLDIRGLDDDQLGEVEAQIRRLAAHPTVPDTSVEVAVTNRLGPMVTSPGSRLLGAARAVASGLGFTLTDRVNGGTSDANATAALGVPTLDGLGPCGGGCHAAWEYVELDTIVPRTALLAGLLLEAPAIREAEAPTAR